MKYNRLLSIIISVLLAIFYNKLFFSRLLLSIIFLFPEFITNAQEQARPADRFVDMIGVNTHFARDRTNYTNSPTKPHAEKNAVNAAINMGIRHLRGGVYGWTSGQECVDMDKRGTLERYIAISKAGMDAGIPNGFTWIITDNSDDWKKLMDEYLIPLGDKVIVLEGANENMGVNGDAQAYSQIRNWWNNILPSIPNLKIASNTGPTAACRIMDAEYIGDNVDFGNAHPYHFWPPFKPWNKNLHCDFNSTPAPPTIALWTAPDSDGGTVGYIEATRHQRIRPDQPMIFTEWGYPSPIVKDQPWAVDNATAPKYLLRGFLEHFNAGIVYSCVYELLNRDENLDEAEGNFGLAYSNGSLKPNGLALKRLIELFGDYGNSKIETGKLNYTFSGGGGLGFVDDKNATTNEIHHTLLQKSDSTFYLVLWQEAVSTNVNGEEINVPPVDVTVNFGHTVNFIKAYLPATTDNSNPVVNTSNVSSISVNVPDHPFVIEIVTKPAKIPATGVKILSSSSTIKVGGLLPLTTKILPNNASSKRIEWISSNPLIATVGYNGIATGISAGNATIFAKTYDGKFKGSLTLKVEAIPVEAVNLGPLNASIEVEETFQLTNSIIPYNATNLSIRWASSDTSIATVNSNGLVLGKAVGIVDITVTTNDGSKTATSKITIKKKLLWTILDDRNTSWAWKGFDNDDCPTCYRYFNHTTRLANSSASINFKGTDIEAFCETWNGAGHIDIYIDDVLKGLFSQSILPYSGAVKFASISGLTNSFHTIKFIALGDNEVGIDYIRYSLQ